MVTLEDGRSALGRATDGGASWAGNVVPALLATAVVAAGTLLLVLGTKLTFLLDDWSFLLYRPGFTADSVLSPHGEHIVVGPVLIYKALQATFGMESAMPFRVVSTGLFLTSAVLLFLYLRRRVDPWLALAGAVVVLFLGPAWEDLLWPFQMGFFAATSAGIGMLLCLERHDRAGDLGACTLLVVAVVFSSLGLPCAVAAAVQVLRGPDRWRRIYVPVIPLIVYAAWYLGWGHEAESALSWSNLATTPLFVVNSVAAAAASALGLATPHDDSVAGALDWGRPVAVGLVVLVAWRLHSLGRIPGWLWTAVALGGSFWIFAGLNEKVGRSPTESRYQYVGAIFLMLILAEVFRGMRLGRKSVILTVLLTAAAVASNVYYLHLSYESYRHTSQLERGALGSLDIAADTVEPGFVLTEELTGTGYVHVEAGVFLDAAEDYGSPGYSPEELSSAPQEVRFAADKVLFGALRAEYVPLGRGDVEEPPRVTSEPANGSVAVGRSACAKVAPGEAGTLVTLPPDGAYVEAGKRRIADLRLRRFSSGGEFPIDMQQTLQPHQAAEIRIPPDRSRVPWKLLVESVGPATVCGRGVAD